ncbi:hypothetical protein JCM8097_002325 [Rhodosporidiobolus ruineniae]
MQQPPEASTSRVAYLPPSPVVPSSDVGESEEARAALLGERYWAKRRRVEDDEGEDMKLDEAEHELSSEDELAMSPFRPQPPSDGTVRPSSRTARSISRSLAASEAPSPLASPSLRVSSHTSPALDKPTSSRRRSPSPAASVASADVDALFSRPRPAAALPSLDSSPSQRSPSPRRPSPSLHRHSPPPSPSASSSRAASSPPPDIPPDPDPLPAGRSFRTRTAAQLKPYSTEQLKYTKTLLRNGWEGAVVRGLRPVEETPEELRRRKLEQMGTKKDSLGGWLVEEEEESQAPSQALPAPARRRSSDYEDAEEHEEEDDLSGSEGSVDGLTMLEREARRKERLERAAEAGLRGKKRKHSPHRHGPSRIDDPHYQPEPSLYRRQKNAKQPRSRSKRASSEIHTEDERDPSTSRRRRLRAESAPPSSSPHPSTSNKKRSLFSSARPRKPADDAPSRPRPSGHSRKSRIRADSEPPASSSPARGGESSKKRAGMARPSKGFHARKAGDGRSALDQDILNLPRIETSSEEDGGGGGGGRYRSDGESEAPSADEASEADEESAERLEHSRLKLGGKRKRALGFMMPAVFMKKAQADLKLMENERDEGEYSSGSEINSGDEEAIERARKEKERRKRNEAKRRSRPALLDQPMRLDGAAFTDESGEDDFGASEEEEEKQDEDDAVGAWLKSFAPTKGAGRGGDEDIVDRFLRRAKRPSKPPKSKGKKAAEGAGVGARDKEPGRANKGKDGRDKQRRDGVYVVEGGHDSRVPARRPRPKTVALDTDQAVFAFAGLRDNNAPASDDEVVVVSPRQRAPLPSVNLGLPPPAPAPAAADPTKDGEIWASFGKFSPDFGIERLPTGVQFATLDSFVKNGYLFSLIDPAGLPSTPFSTDVFGLSLLSSASPDEVAALLPPICDAIFSAFAAIDSSPIDTSGSPLAEATSSLRFLGHYASTSLASSSADERSSFGSTLLSELERLDSRLDGTTINAGALKAFKRRRVFLSWYLVDVAARLQRIAGADIVSHDRLLRLATALIRRLVEHGSDRTTKSLKAVMGDATAGPLTVSDVTVEAWLGLISLAVRSSDFGTAAFSQLDLWQIALDVTRSTLGKKAEKGPAAGEVVSYTVMMLCAISQFSPSGMSTSTPRLQAHWPAAMQTLDAIQPAALAAPDHGLSSTAIARRDRYLWTLFARCLIFVDRWGWRIEGGKDELLPRLFDLLKARRLADLSAERGDIPSFLKSPADFGEVRLAASSDTAFAIFLKLVIAAANSLPSSTDIERRRRSSALTRLFVRLSPLVSSAWTRTSPELRNPSILLNHYSLHLTFALLLPSGAAQRVEHARRLLDFGSVDEDARKTCIRAIFHFLLAFQHAGLPLQPVVDWLADATRTLKKEYVELEQKRSKEHRWADDGGRGDEKLWNRVVMVAMVLRSVQGVLRAKKTGEVEYPDTALLHPAWTSQLLQSPLSLDPMIGRETIQMLTCFLDTRRSALPRPTPPQPAPAGDAGNGESQDDYGMLDDLDFDDPALNAMLGIEPAGAADSQKEREDAVRVKDKVFGQLVVERLSPAFFALVSMIFLDTPGKRPTVTDRIGYAQETVECWMRCVAVAVENQVTDWRPYLQYGNFSAKRVPDAVGRRDVALFLVVEILKHDPAVYSVFTDDILEVWFESLVARRLTVQHILTSFLLNVEANRVGSVCPQLEGLPFERNEASGKVEVEQLDLLDRRDAMLQTVFANAARIVLTSTPSTGSAPLAAVQLLAGQAARPTMPRGTVLNLVRSMLSTMRTNLTSIADETTRRNYAGFVKSTITALSRAGEEGGKKGPFTDAALPDLRAMRGLVAA